jgi:hypothetical protein
MVASAYETGSIRKELTMDKIVALVWDESKAYFFKGR